MQAELLVRQVCIKYHVLMLSYIMWRSLSPSVCQQKAALCEILGSHGGEYEDDLSSGMLRHVVW
jgi:hypothetical protein